MKIKESRIKQLIKESVEKLIEEILSEEETINESEWDLERLGRGRKPMKMYSEKDAERDAEATFKKYRALFPDILKHDDEAFINFLLKTGKVRMGTESGDLKRKLKMMSDAEELRKEKHAASKRGFIGGGRFMAEDRNK